MFFKSLELRGFKSFVDQTKIDFESGVTAIVGPNGCGKSNIADAMRWVLGEQSAKTMRGAKMEDFIFNGSAQRKPTGFAEVTMTISNENGIISTAPYSEYPEISVTRKYFRNGDSEYYINKVPCRLKDIVDVFLDTGVSTKTLSVIEQGQVTRLINSKPEDRRVFIDEAAGIMKYKMRRNAARNKLELSQQNLTRIQDIIGELERQRSSLNRQAKKAERYAAYKAEVKGHALIHYSIEYQRLNAQINSLSAMLDSMRQEEAAAGAQLGAARNNLEVLNSKIAVLEKDISSIREERGGMESALAKNSQHRAFLAAQVEELIGKKGAAQAEIAQVEKSMQDGDAAVAKRKEELAAIEALLTEKTAEAAELRAELEQAQGRLREKERELAEGMSASMSVMEKISSLKNEESSKKARLEMAAARIESLKQKEAQLAAAVAMENEKLVSARKAHDDCSADAAREKQAAQELSGQTEELSAKISETQEKLRAVSEKIAGDNSRRESLLDLERNFEGYGQGVRALMKLKQKQDPAVSGITSLVAEKVAAPAEMEAAMAAALGGRLEAVVVDEFDSLRKAINALRQGNLGSAGFMVSSAAVAPGAGRAVPSHPAIRGRAGDFLKAAGSPVAGNLAAALEETLVVEGLEPAVEIWKQNPGAFTIVTLAGEVIDKTGFVTGGSGSSPAAGLVSRKRIIEELGAALTSMREQKDALTRQKEEQTAALAALKEKMSLCQAQARKLELETIRLANEIKKAENEIRREDAAREGIIKETGALAAENESMAASLAVIVEKIEALSAQKTVADSANASAREQIAQARAALDQIVGRTKDKEVEITEMKGRRQHGALDLKRMEDIKAADVLRVQRLRESIADSGKKDEQMRRSMETILEENARIARDIDSISGRISSMTDGLNDLLAKADEAGSSIGGLQERVEKLRADISQASLKKSEAQMLSGNVVEKADLEFNIPVEDLAGASAEGVDPAENESRLAFLRGQLARMGDVNMSAIEEYEQVEQRYVFLTTQRDDLQASIATLHKTIESLNATTNKLFLDTFAVVSENFQKIFKRLFGGGHAEMKLVQEEGKPEPGVDIFAQPPGKKNQNITLLSAGEKAMTAISILFAVFMSKPSPFCLLDEIDAPLDEANIGRFRDMLGDMQDKTQFIIITHNQKTMGFADRLYGVTQEEEGVSKVLAVNLKDDRPQNLTAA